MIEVDSIRRMYPVGHYDPGVIGGHPLGAPGAQVAQQPLDKHNALVHWNRVQGSLQGQGSCQGSSSGSRSDEEEDEDDEYRPFTPPPPRERLSYTRYQLELLNGIYHEVRYPNSTQKLLIAKRVGITRDQVKIWFQNRRRKDVVGTTGKNKSCDDSSSSNTSKDSTDEKSAEDISSDDSCKDSEDSVVPSAVLKGVVGELFRFTKDPLKGKKNKKKTKSKKNVKEAIKKGLVTTLMTGQYDMVSPPNQVIPSAFFDKVKKGFTHSKRSSAFEAPRDPSNPAQISSISSTTRERTPPTVSSGATNMKNAVAAINHVHNNVLSNRSLGNYPYSSQPGHFMHSVLPLIQSNGCDLPVLSDLLSYKSAMDARLKPATIGGQGQGHNLSTAVSSAASTTTQNEINIRHSSINSYNSGVPTRPIGGIFPFPFLADQPVILSSLRQPDQIYRPSPHYPLPHYSEDPYQPLIISSLSNPYYAPPPAAWANQNSHAPNAPTFTQL